MGPTVNKRPLTTLTDEDKIPVFCGRPWVDLGDAGQFFKTGMGEAGDSGVW